MEELLESDVCRNPKNVRVLLIALILKKMQNSPHLTIFLKISKSFC